MHMPPYAMWLRSAGRHRPWMRRPGEGCRGSTVAAVRLNGSPAFAQ